MNLLKPSSFYARFVEGFARDTHDAYAISTSLMVDHYEWRQLVTRAMPDPNAFSDHLSFSRAYFCQSLFKKVGDREVGIDKKAVAITAFKQAEATNRITNARLHRCRTRETPGLDAKLFRISAKIASLLQLDRLDRPLLEVLFGDCHHGNRSTTSVKFADAGLDVKYESHISVTPDAAQLFLELSPCFDWPYLAGWAEGKASVARRMLSLTKGDKLTVVNKDAKTDRTIFIGPTANIFLQLGPKEFLQRCLLRAGCDLGDQETNRNLARFAASTGTLATVDIKNASNSVTYELVKAVLPVDLFDILDTIRSKFYDPGDGLYRPYEMFSGMGNGFTFPLETLIFWAIASCVCEDHGFDRSAQALCLGVYGDDIIVPVACVKDLYEWLDVLGFAPNTQKSFADGPFRESCGYQGYLDFDVTPMYWKGFQSEDLQPWEICRFAHAFLAWGERNGGINLYSASWNALLSMYKLLCREKEIKPVPWAPFWGPPDSGFPITDTDYLNAITDKNGICRWVGFKFLPATRKASEVVFLRAWHRTKGTRSQTLNAGLSTLFGIDSRRWVGNVDVPKTGATHLRKYSLYRFDSGLSPD